MLKFQSLGLIEAEKAIAGGIAAAQSRNRAMAFAVADHRGEMIATARMDGAHPRILTHSIRKAFHRGGDVPPHAEFPPRSRGASGRSGSMGRCAADHIAGRSGGGIRWNRRRLGRRGRRRSRMTKRSQGRWSRPWVSHWLKTNAERDGEIDAGKFSPSGSKAGCWSADMIASPLHGSGNWSLPLASPAWTRNRESCPKVRNGSSRRLSKISSRCCAWPALVRIPSDC